MLVSGIKASQAQQFANQLRKVIETTCGPAVIPGEAARITASFGVASFDFGASTLAELIKQADQALYLAKSSGRNRVCRYDELTSGQLSALVAAA
jgi:diguanylate cyclase (GGDEF)-like protein